MAITCAGFLLLLVATGFASRDDVKLTNRYGQVGLWNTHSAKTLNRYGLQTNFWGSYTAHDDFLVNFWDRDGDPGLSDPIDPIPGFNAGEFNISVGYGFTDFFDLAVMVPVYLDKIAKDSNEDIITDNTVKGGAGDLEVSMKFQYPPNQESDFFKMAYYGAMSFPTGNTTQGRFPRHNYYYAWPSEDTTYIYSNDGNVEVDMKMLWTWDFRELSEEFPVLFHFNYGLRWNTNPDLEHVFMLNAGLDIRPRPWVNVFLDYSAQPSFSSVERRDVVLPTGEERQLGLLDDPMRLSPGIAFLTPGGFNFSAGAQISVANEDKQFLFYGREDALFETAVEPKAKFVASIGWNGIVFEEEEPRVGKDNPEVYSWPRAESITYGQSLRNARLYGGSADIDGEFSFVHRDSVPNAGVREYSVVFTPRDTTNYAAAFNDVSVTIENVETSVTAWPRARSITYGQSLNEAELRGGRADVDGEFFFVEGDTKPDAGTASHVVRFVPEDTVNYTISNRDIEVEVAKARPEVSQWPETDTITEGASLADVSLSSGRASVAGSFAFAEPEKEPSEGIESHEMIFTPDDTDNYETVRGSASVTVEREAPRAQVIQRGALILEGVNFELGSADLTRESYSVLDRVVESLRDWPEIELRVEGHTDATGSDSLNRRLSYERAKAVVDYFISQGIQGSRLSAVGKGPDEPIASNATADGRAENRRVELHRID
ncbi:hypothetical protein CALK_0880 [Chitinivibrio alkaliphilus ACht1]|uniref:OmpA-like domain-containing protein n=2 Tax=Chitinivibrio TaxID=1505231 RepID=U7D990_9BACT|nr:hypothetical protein CALK_0880 [Chitinivibrio alkaliphilus ACht1]